LYRAKTENARANRKKLIPGFFKPGTVYLTLFND